MKSIAASESEASYGAQAPNRTNVVVPKLRILPRDYELIVGHIRVNSVFLFYSQSNLRESKAAHGHSDAGLPVAEANIATGGGATTAFMPSYKLH